MFTSRSFRLASVLAALTVIFAMTTVDTAEARRGGSFGTRGARTFQAPPATNTAPNTVAPVQRTMTNAPAANTPAANAAARGNQGMLGGLGGNLMRGLFLGGLFGLLMGAGFGGLGGMFSLLFQVLMIGGLVWLAMYFLRPRTATAGGPNMQSSPYMGNRSEPQRPMGGGRASGGGGKPTDTIGVTAADFDIFEQRLGELQAAYSREDFGKLRQITTPEILSYLSEELATNASRGVRNEVSEVKLLQGDLAEAWREGSTDWATVAMRYSSIDATRERATGTVVEGDAEVPTEATELWTFTREGRNGEWKLSAIQDA